MIILKQLLLILSLLITSGFAQSIAADSGTPLIDQRQQLQEQRIRQGIKSGELTPAEAHRLIAQQQQIDHFEAIAKRDGVVTQGERAHLLRQQNMASRNIFRQKHDSGHK